MHPNAKQWDKDHGFDTSFATGAEWPKNKPIPEGRPCDSCGESVIRGFIHTECQARERDKFLDIL